MKRVELKSRRRLCRLCRQHTARFEHRGRVLADKDHELCFRCHESVRDATHAWLSREHRRPYHHLPAVAR